MSTLYKKSKADSLQKKVLFVVFAIILVAIVLEATNTISLFRHKPTAYTTGSQYTKGEPATTNTSSNSAASSSTNNSNNKQGTTNTSSSAPLLTPLAGALVSNHRPSLSGPTDQKTISSVCTTSPGASCVITFTKDGMTKSLTAETIDQGGSAYWTWNAQDLLTPGTWSVMAVATLNGQTKSATDAENMVVSP